MKDEHEEHPKGKKKKSKRNWPLTQSKASKSIPEKRKKDR